MEPLNPSCRLLLYTLHTPPPPADLSDGADFMGSHAFGPEYC